ncbi:MAG: DUF2023 family protein [Spirochaetales bacterium]|nr:DUF2023 family protein [Spirochaetales bacterium]MBR6200031.1 DUF2023 family protein [Spirochaetales bacterium]
MEVLCHHIYEFTKGLRSLVLHTMNAKHLDEATNKLKTHHIDYIVRFVGKDKINIFFGKKQCVDLINSFGNKPLNEYTDEEDFILGVLLGYDKIAECERYMSRKNHSTYSAAGKVKMKEAK